MGFQFSVTDLKGESKDERRNDFFNFFKQELNFKSQWDTVGEPQNEKVATSAQQVFTSR